SCRWSGRVLEASEISSHASERFRDAGLLRKPKLRQHAVAGALHLAWQRGRMNDIGQLSAGGHRPFEIRTWRIEENRELTATVEGGAPVRFIGPVAQKSQRGRGRRLAIHPRQLIPIDAPRGRGRGGGKGLAPPQGQLDLAIKE